MAIISNGTTVVSGGGLSISVTPPTSVNTVGTYGYIVFNNGGTNGAIGVGGTMSNSNMRFTNVWGQQPTNITPSGTWRAMGAQDNDGNAKRTTVGVRIA
jgi:hypothetical protein